MTTAREVKRLLAPILARHPDLVMVAPRFVALRPVHHVLRGIFIERSSSAVWFRPRWISFDLFVGLRGFDNNAGSEVRGRGRWHLDRPGVAEDLDECLETQALPRLRAMRTIPDYVATATGDEMIVPTLAWPEIRMGVHVAMGELDAARAICAERARFWERPSTPYYAEIAAIGQRLHPLLLAEDRAGLAEALHAWEVRNVERLTLQAVWERTPFPLEASPAPARPGEGPSVFTA